MLFKLILCQTLKTTKIIFLEKEIIIIPHKLFTQSIILTFHMLETSSQKETKERKRQIN